jgi:hypothetical protein
MAAVPDRFMGAAVYRKRPVWSLDVKAIPASYGRFRVLM